MLVFSSYNCRPYEVKLEKETLDINSQSFHDYLGDILENSIKEARNFGKDNAHITEKSPITAILISYQYRWCDDSTSIIDIAADLLFDVITGHKLFNGNKRTALITTGATLDYFGFYLKNKRDDTEFLNFWAQF